MSKSVGLVTLFLFFFLYHSANNGGPGDEVLRLYRKADRLFKLENPTDESDSIALSTFREVIKLLGGKPADSLLFQSWLKTGVLLDVKARVDEAKDAYIRAIGVRGKGDHTRDSTLFLAYVYAGTAYYHLNHFDSADYYLQQAETIGNNFPHVPEKDRLYNALGALYFENGNYMQSRNYFSRALEIIQEDRPSDKESALHFENNIAASYHRLGQYDESIKQYRKLLGQKLYTDKLYLNMGKAYTSLGQYADAMKCYRHVSRVQVPEVYNEIANAQLQASHPDSAAWFLDQFEKKYQENSDRYNKMDLGINYIYRSDLLNQQKRYINSATLLQKAINIFSGDDFSNDDIYSNPTNFIGSFASYKLFDALYRKAITFETLYRTEKSEKYLGAAYNTYQQTISLLRYIEKSYDTDDAKIFLKRNSQDVYRNAFSLCMKLQALHPDKGYLEQAFLITEKNKASIIAARLTESRLKKMRGIDPALLQEERNIKYNIARLNIKSEGAPGEGGHEAIAREKEHFEIELSRLQKKIEQNSSYYKLKYNDSFPSVHQVQKYIDGDQAIISFYGLDSVLYVFGITGSSFTHTVIHGLPALKEFTEQWLAQLQTTESGRKFNGGNAGNELYKRLVQPVQKLVGNKGEWILIPDDILHYLPFESLPAGDGPLLESTVVSYHFSSRFIIPHETKRVSANSYTIFSLAPFSKRAFLPMDRLPASEQEIAGLPGKQFTDSQATKERFLQEFNQFPIIHLATHAVADAQNPSASYVAFYPKNKNASENNLYLDELYGLNMDGTELVIISACETGTGKLVSSEGVISLSRGFTYAGCEAVVNSLWKAEDVATAAILERFHKYLEQGLSKSKALQKAKLDYIHSDALHKTPNYWAHLILIGNVEPLKARRSGMMTWILAGLAGIAAIGTVILVQKKRKKSRRGFTKDD